MKGIFFACVFLASAVAFANEKITRPQKYAAYRAHTILPDSLKFLVKRNGKHLFEGLERGLSVPAATIDENLIIQAVNRITEMVNEQRPFKEVVAQMGFVTGLLGVFTDPSRGATPVTRAGFRYYLNHKLGRFLFVFDGFRKEEPVLVRVRRDMAGIDKNRSVYRRLLEEQYLEVNGNYRYGFDERSAVFGVCSIYFSNLARLSALLWYDAWSAANGDLTRTPFVDISVKRLKSAP